MEATTLSFINAHNHGELFANFFRARHDTFIRRNKWDLPQADGMEFDQYDTPASRWVVVHERGSVLAGLRLTPSTHHCGIYSYMIRDAQKGLLGTIPTNFFSMKRLSPATSGNARGFSWQSMFLRKRECECSFS